MKLYLHIGTTKTGSTAIQNALRTSPERLLSANACFVNSHQIIDTLLQGQVTSNELALKNEELHKLARKEQAKKVHTLILSSESLVGDPMTGHGNAPEMARRLKELSKGFDTQIICYLRRQDSFMESLYAQTIHQGRIVSFDDFFKQMEQIDLDYDVMLDAFAQVFGADRLIVKRYCKSLFTTSHALLDDFGSTIGTTGLKPPTRSRHVNASYSPQALAVALTCNDTLEEEQKIRLRYYLQKVSSQEITALHCYLTPEQRQRVLQRYEASNAAVAKHYLGTNDPLFSDAMPAAEHAPIKLDADEVANIFMQSLLELDRQMLEFQGRASIVSLYRIEKSINRFISRFPAVKRWIKQLVRS